MGTHVCLLAASLIRRLKASTLQQHPKAREEQAKTY
jgi:hypothetical protein